MDICFPTAGARSPSTVNGKAVSENLSTDSQDTPGSRYTPFRDAASTNYHGGLGDIDEYDIDEDFTSEMVQFATDFETEFFGQPIDQVPYATHTVTHTSNVQETTQRPPLSRLPSYDELQADVNSSEIRPFFTHRDTLNYEDDNDTDDEAELDSESEEIPESGGDDDSVQGRKSWFKQPKHMPDWLYTYFNNTIRPLLTAKEKKKLLKPALFSDNGPFSPPSFWIHPPEPALLLSRGRFDPTPLYRPRVYLWLPHFLVENLFCPNPTCKAMVLEKNGMLPPRRIFDVENVFYIVSWGYYCRKGCRKHFAGWNTAILNSLPAYLRLAFPAILSHRGGLSHGVMAQLRVGNQHKMGPSGVRSLLIEMHTQFFNRVQLQFIEKVFEQARRHESDGVDQETLYAYLSSRKGVDFGHFGDPQKYGGRHLSEHFLTDMLNKAIEKDEHDANQHTACLAPDQIAIDDSHKINKHIAKIDGSPIFGGLWTCMDSHIIRGQALTLTKAHDERIGPLSGIAKSIQLYGHPNPRIAFSDDPIKDKALLKATFPSLFENLTPMAVAHGLQPLELPPTTKVLFLDTPELVEGIFSSLMAPIDIDDSAFMCVHLDAEWNISRNIGVSIIQITLHADPNNIYIIPVHKFNNKLPTSLLRLLISQRIFKVGSGIKGDLTRLKRQFSQLKTQTSFNVIDLKEFCIRRGIIPRQSSAPLDVLLEKTAGQYLSKDDDVRRCNDWETKKLRPDLIEYAALDVFASRVIFEKACKVAVIPRVDQSTPLGTQVILFVQEGGQPAAYGRICLDQPNTFNRVRVKVPTRSRVLVEVDTVLIKTAAAILHLLPPKGPEGKTKANALTLGQLQASSSSSTFRVVVPFSHLGFDQRDSPSSLSTQTQVLERKDTTSNPILIPDNDPPPISCSDSQYEDDTELDPELDPAELSNEGLELEEEESRINMLEAYCQVTAKSTGKKRQLDVSDMDQPSSLPSSLHKVEDTQLPSTFNTLRNAMKSPPDLHENYTLIKKDIFHAFHMLPIPVNHGARPAFLRALRDHILQWDPISRAAVGKVCEEKFKLTFDQMLLRNPRFIAERTPRHVPPPSILTASIEHVYSMFHDAVDAKTGVRLFTDQFQMKANAVLALARQGYLSDVEGVPMYEKAGYDKFGLQKWKCLRGTNNVEGGPHGDIYRKFGALNAGPRLTTNCLTDHRTWYNLQAYAMHLFGVDWTYHHNLGMINRTAFLLNYLSDIMDGAKSYSHWINGDLYERTSEQFGICQFPESLRTRLLMEPYSDLMAKRFKLDPNNDWLRKRQGLALPALPPTTPEARQYYFTKIRDFTESASVDGKKHVNFEAFAQEWNRTADGKERFYVTHEVLSGYSKGWEKTSNISATQELMSKQMESIKNSANVFAAGSGPFPSFIVSTPRQVYPSQGVIQLEDTETVDSVVPSSLVTNPPISCSLHSDPNTPTRRALTSQALLNFTSLPEENTSDIGRLSSHATLPPNNEVQQLQITSTAVEISRQASSSSSRSSEGGSAPTTKRRRVVPEDQRKRQTVRSCRRCQKPECPGNNNILKCPTICTVPCRWCKRTEGCRGVDKGKKCTVGSGQ